MLSLYLPGCIYLNFFTKHRQSYLQLSNFRSYGLLDAVGHCSSSIPSMWDELRRNQCSSFSHSRQPQLRGWGGGGRKRKGERRGRERGERERRKRKREHSANVGMTEALKSPIRQWDGRVPLKRVHCRPWGTASSFVRLYTNSEKSAISLKAQTEGSNSL